MPFFDPFCLNGRNGAIETGFLKMLCYPFRFFNTSNYFLGRLWYFERSRVCLESRSTLFPFITILSTEVLISRISPDVAIKVAFFPFSRLPSSFLTPQISAGSMVMAYPGLSQDARCTKLLMKRRVSVGRPVEYVSVDNGNILLCQQICQFPSLFCT